MFRKLMGREQVRFLLIGGLNTLVSYSLFVAFYLLLGKDWYLLAYVLSYAIALVSGFALQRKFVFRVSDHLLLDFFRYTLVQLGAFGANLLLLPALVELAGVNPLIAQAIVIILTVVGSYFAHRYFSFRRKSLLETKELS